MPFEWLVNVLDDCTLRLFGIDRHGQWSYLAVQANSIDDPTVLYRRVVRGDSNYMYEYLNRIGLISDNDDALRFVEDSLDIIKKGDTTNGTR